MLETRDGGKGTGALLRKPATWEDGGLMSQRPSSPSRRSPRVLQEKVQETVGAVCRKSKCPGS